MFVHLGWLHIFFNVVIQIFLGSALELVHCWWRVAIVYLAGVLAGSMGSSIVNPTTPLAGASGGVYALLTAHIATIMVNWRQMKYAWAQLFFFIAYCAADIARAIYFDAKAVSHAAHIFGAIAGILVGIGVLRNLKVEKFEKKLWWIAVMTYVTLMTAGILFHVYNEKYFPATIEDNSSGF